MNRILWPGCFSVELPEFWDYQETEGVIICRDPECLACALQFSLYNRPAKEPPTEAEAAILAREFAGTQHWELDDPDIVTGTSDSGRWSRVLHADESPAATFWCVWHLVADSRFALITYVCDTRERDADLPLLESVFESFEWEQRLV